MMLRVRQALRFVRVMIACAVLAFAARPAPSAPVWAEVPQLIAYAVAARPASPAPEVARPRFVRPAAELVRAALPPAPAPVNTERSPRIACDRYLENCSFLC
jgi:hypothetical protein